MILHRFLQCFANAPNINVFSLFLSCLERLLKMRDCALGLWCFESAPKLCDFALLLHCFDILLKMCNFVLVFGSVLRVHRKIIDFPMVFDVFWKCTEWGVGGVGGAPPLGDRVS